jgi:hypothetical protein
MMNGKGECVQVMTLKVLDMHMSFFSFIYSSSFIWIGIFSYNILLEGAYH